MTAGRHALVTGGAGFIGSHIVERLLGDGRRVVIIDNLSTGSLDNLHAVRNEPRLTVVQSGVADYAALDDVVRNADSIYHFAATVGVDLVLSETTRSLRNNFAQTEAILLAAAKHQVPLLMASSSEVYGRSAKTAFFEEDDLVIGPPTCARWSYAASKIMGECLALSLAREQSVPVTIARIFNTVGPRQSGHYGMVLPRFVAAAKTNQPLRVFGDGRQSRCFCWIDDTVEALVRLERCLNAKAAITNVGNDEEISILDLARLVIEIRRSSSPIQLVPYAEAYPPGFEDFQRRRPDLSRLKTLIDFRPRTQIAAIIQRL